MTDDQRLRTASALSEGWDGKAWKRIRGGDGLTVLQNRRVALNLMVQPLVAERLLSDETLRDQGLLSRILVTSPPPASGTRFWREPKPESGAALKTYSDHLLGILRLSEPPEEEPLRLLELDNHGRRLFTAFSDSIEKELGSDGAFAPIRGLANKAAEHAARLAGVLTIVRDQNARVIPAVSLAAGIEIMNHYLEEALRLRAVALVDGELQRAARLLTWLQQKWDESLVSLVEIYQQGPREFRDKRSAESAARILEEHGWLVPLEEAHEIKGVRRREVWRIVRMD